MNKERNTYLVIGVVFIALIILYFSIEAALTQWEYNLDIKKKNAYGLYMSHQLIKEKFTPVGFEMNTDKSVRDFLAEKNTDKKYTYLFIGATPYFDSVSVDTLLELAQRGSTVILACDNLNDHFNRTVLKNKFHTQVESNFSLGIDMLDELFQTGTKPYTHFNFTHPNLKSRTAYPFMQKYKSDTVARYFLNFETVSDTEPVPAYDPLNSIKYSGYQADDKGRETGQNFGIFNYGEGKFVILLSSLPFTNYYMRNARGLEYLEKVFAHVPAGHPLVWDEYARSYHPEDGQHEQGTSEFGNSPLYFVLQNKSLRMAWYLLLTALLIYAFFAAKRRQQIIPVLEPKANTSLQYVETIGQLYYDETEHQEIAREMRLQFFNFLRKKYFLPIQQLDSDTIRIVSAKTGVAADILEKLALYFEDLKKVRSFNADKLSEYNHQLEQFYATCK